MPARPSPSSPRAAPSEADDDDRDRGVAGAHPGGGVRPVRPAAGPVSHPAVTVRVPEREAEVLATVGRGGRRRRSRRARCRGGGGAARRPRRPVRALRLPRREPHRRQGRDHLRAVRGRRRGRLRPRRRRARARELADGLAATGAGTGPVPFKETAVFLYVPWAAKRLADSLVAAEPGIDLLLHALVSDVVVDDDRIRALVLATKQGPKAIEGRVFVDCTGDADVGDVRRGADRARAARAAPVRVDAVRHAARRRGRGAGGRWRASPRSSPSTAAHLSRDGGALHPDVPAGRVRRCDDARAQPRRHARRRHRRARGDLGRARGPPARGGGGRVPAARTSPGSRTRSSTTPRSRSACARPAGSSATTC